MQRVARTGWICGKTRVKRGMPMGDFPQCLQNFLQALRKILQALQIFAPCVLAFRHTSLEYSDGGEAWGEFLWKNEEYAFL